jgi:peptidoglycan/LPS O-acetylase OafA/YrhL
MKPKTTNTTKPHLLYLDLIKILAMALVLYSHIPGGWLPFQTTAFGTYGLGGLGITIFLFASGAGLSYSDREYTSVLSFYKNKLLRIYPAYWMAFALSIAIFPATLVTSSHWFEQITGTVSWFGLWWIAGSVVKVASWFFGIILFMYLVYPFLKKWFDSYTTIKMICLLSFSIAFKFWLVSVNNFGIEHLNYICPLVWIGWFGLGIWVTKMGYFQKWNYRNDIIILLANMAFYVYLIQEAIFPIYTNISPIAFWIVLSLVSVILYLADQQVQRIIKDFDKK